jgi:hypothetical protein
MTQYTAFSTEVRIGLAKRGWNFGDLADEVSKRTGLFCDSSYLSRILSGERNPPKVIAAIREILDLKEDST